jgi:hypothetical protein
MMQHRWINKCVVTKIGHLSHATKKIPDSFIVDSSFPEWIQDTSNHDEQNMAANRIPKSKELFIIFVLQL